MPSTQILSLKDDDEGTQDSDHVTRGTLGLWTVNQLLGDGVWLPSTNESFVAPEEPAQTEIVRDTILQVAGISESSAQAAVLNCLQNPDQKDADGGGNCSSASSASDSNSSSSEAGDEQDTGGRDTGGGSADSNDSESESNSEVSAGLGREICQYSKITAFSASGGCYVVPKVGSLCVLCRIVVRKHRIFLGIQYNSACIRVIYLWF